MNDKLCLLKNIACSRIVNMARQLCGLGKDEKVRLKHELHIMEDTGTEQYFIDLIAKADEEKKRGSFYMPGAFNCSFLLYCAGATTINPMLFGSPFERLINPLAFNAQLLPPFEACRDKFSPLPWNEYETADEAVFAVAQREGLIDSRLAGIAKKYAPAANYQFVSEVLAKSRGIIVWQEQIIELLRRMGGFSYARADQLRREGGKGLWRNNAWYGGVRDIFLPHAQACGYSHYFADSYLRYIFEANIYTQLKAHVAAKLFFE